MVIPGIMSVVPIASTPDVIATEPIQWTIPVPICPFRVPSHMESSTHLVFVCTHKELPLNMLSFTCIFTGKFSMATSNVICFNNTPPILGIAASAITCHVRRDPVVAIKRFNVPTVPFTAPAPCVYKAKTLGISYDRVRIECYCSTTRCASRNCMSWIMIELENLIPNIIGINDQRLAKELKVPFFNSILIDLTAAAISLEFETANIVISRECMLSNLESPLVIHDFHSLKS